MEWKRAAGGAAEGSSPKLHIKPVRIPSAMKPEIVTKKTTPINTQSYIIEASLTSETNSLLTNAIRTPISRTYPKI